MKALLPFVGKGVEIGDCETVYHFSGIPAERGRKSVEHVAAHVSSHFTEIADGFMHTTGMTVPGHELEFRLNRRKDKAFSGISKRVQHPFIEKFRLLHHGVVHAFRNLDD